jgi:hypothetical protein
MKVTIPAENILYEFVATRDSFGCTPVRIQKWFLHVDRSAFRDRSSINHIDMNMQINKVRELLGELPTEMPGFLSDATIRRFLHARNWSTIQATKTLKEAVKWRRQYKPEKIRWVSIAIAHRG